jgi:hypothetical protein
MCNLFLGPLDSLSTPRFRVHLLEHISSHIALSPNTSTCTTRMMWLVTHEAAAMLLENLTS